jgi:hypothetical protein
MIKVWAEPDIMEKQSIGLFSGFADNRLKGAAWERYFSDDREAL